MQAFSGAAKTGATMVLVGLLAIAGFPGDVEANTSEARRCAEKRLKVLSKAVRDRLACHGRATQSGRVDPDCLARADSKLRDRWTKTDDRRDCPSEGDRVLDQARDSVVDFVGDVIDRSDLGLDPNAPNNDRLVFFLPLCQGPDDFSGPPSVISAYLGSLGFPTIDHWPVKCLPPTGWSFLNPFGFATQTLANEFPLGGYKIDQNLYGAWCAEAAYAAGFFGGSPTNFVDLEEGMGKFDPWLSTPNSSPASRFTRDGDRYVLPSGTKVADDWFDLTDGSLDHGIDEFIDGTPVPAEAMAWTATDASGEAAPHHCDDWTEPDTGVVTSGLAVSSSSAWTANEITSCSLPLVSANGAAAPLTGVYCVQQSGAAPLCQELSDGRCAGNCGAGLACAPLAGGGCGCRPGAP